MRAGRVWLCWPHGLAHGWQAVGDWARRFYVARPVGLLLTVEQGRVHTFGLVARS
jgi:hypothetical protein